MLLDDDLKEIWLANIPAVLIAEENQRRAIDPTTKEGIYNRVLLKTGSEEIARLAMNQFIAQQALDAAVAANAAGTNA